MKKLALISALFSLVSCAPAVQIYEAFNYVRGSLLAGQGGWVLATGTSPKVATNALVTPGLQPATEGNSAIFGNGPMELRRGLKNLLGGEQPGPYWYSMAFKIEDLGALSTNGGFIAAFSATNQSIYGGRLYLRKDPAGNPLAYNIGVAKASGVAQDIVWSSTLFNVGRTNFVVCSYHTGDTSDNTLLWI